MRHGRSRWITRGPGIPRAPRSSEDSRYGAQFLHVTWKDNESTPFIELKSRVETRDRSIDTAKPNGAAALWRPRSKIYTAATELTPTDGIVKETALKIVADAKSDLDKARAIYEWIVDNTFRDPKTRGCGAGDVAGMLKSGNFGGKCADLNALCVGLARAAGLPARDIYGLRVAPSKFGYKSLGPTTEVVTKAQHCRAEVFLTGRGWVPIDPADVRKVVLEEPPGNLAVTDPRVAAARRVLFGAWETNWIAYNSAHDIALPGSSGPKIAFLMYPQAEVNGERRDCLAPDDFKYKITAREITA